jgi:HAD superfamily hydrolase (TIGR01509 family)
MRLRALLWDVDGTLAETERDGHRVAFNMTFEQFGFDWRWSVERYGELLKVAGGRERMLADFVTHDDVPADPREREELAATMHRQKNIFYAELVHEGRLSLRPGVTDLMEDCRRSGVLMGITTTTSRSNLEALMSVQFGDDWRESFATVVVGENVRRKKPDPEVFEIALSELALTPAEAIAIEDSPAGVAAAKAASIPVIVTRSTYFADAPMPGAAAVGAALDRSAGWKPAPIGENGHSRITIDDIESWHRSAVDRS